jgi:hypothetical protein
MTQKTTTPTIQALSKIAAAKSKEMNKNCPRPGPGRGARQIANSIYADLLAGMSERKRYHVVEVIWDLAHAEVNMSLGKI